MAPTNEERIATLEAHKETQGGKLDELRSDVKAIPHQLQQFSDDLKSAFRRETRRCRRIQAQRCPAMHSEQGKKAGGDPGATWSETIKQAAVGLSILGALLGSAYYGAQDNARPMIQTTKSQGGTK